jgi:dipeptidyl aminopeptidase/acylaminoacyl peptidase
MIRLFFLSAILLSTYVFSQTPEQAPSEFFSRLPQFENVDLSPDGKNLAFMQNLLTPEVAVLRVINLETSETVNVLKTDNEKLKIRWFEWANDRSILISTQFAGQRGVTDTVETRMLVIDIDEVDKGGRPVLNKRKAVNAQGFPSQFQDTVVDFLPDDPENILVAIDSDTTLEPSVFKVNIYNKKQKRLEKGKRKIRSWFTDRQHNLRLGYAIDYNNGEVAYYERKNKKANWRALFKYNSIENPEQEIRFSGFDLDPNILYYKKYHEDKLALFKLDLEKDEHSLVFADPDYDVDGSLIYSKKTNGVIGIRHSNTDTGRIYWDESHDAMQKALSKALPDTHNFVTSFSKNENVYVLYTENDNIPGVYYLGYRRENQLFPLLVNYPELEEIKLVEHKFVSYKARDGLEIEGYISRPVGTEGPIPTVVFPHGGPGARDYAGFDYWTAFLADREYAVFRPNFRGSQGFGFSFAQSQIQSWGLQMQDDITDGVKWLVAEKFADPDNICILGASYGGYAALMATVKTPELFKCAVSFAGVSDLHKLVNDSRRYANSEFVENQIGSKRKDLKSRSPIEGVDKISTPILLVHGEDDRVVDAVQSRKMVKELEKSDKAYRYVELEKGDHHLSLQKNRHAFFKEVDAFLGKYLN